MIQFACPGCKKQYRVKDEMAGKTGKCKECGQPMQIPAANAPAAETPAAVVTPVQNQTPAPSADAAAFASHADAVAPAAAASVSPASQPLPTGNAFPSQPVTPQAGSAAAASEDTIARTTPELGYEISQRPDFSIVKIDLPAGKKILSEPSAMVSMTPSVKMVAGFKGGIGKTLGRMLGGESLIINTFTAEDGPAEIMFAGGAAGDIAYQRLEGQTLYLQRGAYMLNTEGVEVTGKWQGAKGFFGGEGLVLLKASGTGDVFFNSYGAILEIDVTDGFIVDSGYIVAFEESLDYKVTVLPGLRSGGKIKSFFFGGEGLVCQFSGAGKVWIQTRNVQSFLSWANGFRPTKSN